MFLTLFVFVLLTPLAFTTKPIILAVCRRQSVTNSLLQFQCLGVRVQVLLEIIARQAEYGRHETNFEYF